MAKIRMKLLAAGTALLFVSAACDGDGSSELSSGAPADAGASGQTGEEDLGNGGEMPQGCSASKAQADYSPLGINSLVNLTHAGVVGSFESVPPPSRSNDPSTGLKFYGDATFRVERVIFDSPEIPAKADDLLSIRLMAINDCGMDSYTENSGPVRPGMRALLLVARIPNSPPVNMITYRVAWRIEDGPDGREHGRSRDPRRDAPLDVIEKTVREERTAGRQPGRDQGTEEEPFSKR